MSVVHRITGYDKRTELLSIEHDIPTDKLSLARKLAHVPASDPDVFGSYPLSVLEARELAQSLHKDIAVDLYDWFIEPFNV